MFPSLRDEQFACSSSFSSSSSSALNDEQFGVRGESDISIILPLPARKENVCDELVSLPLFFSID